MKKIYIAGPYSSVNGETGEDANTLVAAEVAAQYFKLGWAVFCPHTMTQMIDRKFNRDPQDIHWEDWLASDIAWILCCDAIHMLPGWQTSKGASTEYLVAKGAGLKIYMGGQGIALPYSADGASRI